MLNIRHITPKKLKTKILEIVFIIQKATLKMFGEDELNS